MNKQIGNYERRTEALWEIAKQDEVYQLWYSEYEKHRSKYQSIRRFLPKKLRYFLDSYISYNSVMLNRVISIACMCMEFTGERPTEFNIEKQNIIAFKPKTKYPESLNCSPSSGQ